MCTFPPFVSKNWAETDVMFDLTQSVVVEPVHKIYFEKNKRILVISGKPRSFFIFYLITTKATVSVEEEIEVD